MNEYSLAKVQYFISKYGYKFSDFSSKNILKLEKYLFFNQKNANFTNFGTFSYFFNLMQRDMDVFSILRHHLCRYFSM